jgi:hypothetical protein
VRGKIQGRILFRQTSYFSRRSIIGMTRSKSADGMDSLFLRLLHVVNVATSATS